jgi:hypothetical protein
LAVTLLLSSWVGFPAWRLPWTVLSLRITWYASRSSDPRAVIEAVARLPGRAAIVSGWILPRITLALDGDREGPHQFIYLVENLSDYQNYLTEGWKLYYLPGVDLYESQAHDLNWPNWGRNH